MVGSDINYAFPANIHFFFVFQNMCDLLSGAGGRAQPQGASVRVPGLAPQGLPLKFEIVFYGDGPGRGDKKNAPI